MERNFSNKFSSRLISYSYSQDGHYYVGLPIHEYWDNTSEALEALQDIFDAMTWNVGDHSWQDRIIQPIEHNGSNAVRGEYSFIVYVRQAGTLEGYYMVSII